ncbi:MAG: vWA domain-containing protein [Myxococcota bacterium]
MTGIEGGRIVGRGLLGALLLLGCSPDGGDDGFDFSTESNGPGSPGASSGTADSSGGGTTDPTGAVTTSGSGTDTGGDADSSTSDDLPPAVPCTGVDVLFVVDNSEPMLEEQIRLRGTALAFIQQIQSTIPTLTENINIGVITTDEDQMVQANAEPCGPYEGGLNWMISSSMALSTELECALSVGIGGSPNERPMDMLLTALDDDNLAPDGFHNGFLREDALLVVVIVTNEEDDVEADTSWGSMGDPATWVTTLADKKGGWLNDIVVYSLVGIEEPNACVGPWDGVTGAQHSPRLIDFTWAFPQGAVGDVCEQEYASFLLGVVPGVAAACAGYIPP